MTIHRGDQHPPKSGAHATGHTVHGHDAHGHDAHGHDAHGQGHHAHPPHKPEHPHAKAAHAQPHGVKHPHTEEAPSRTGLWVTLGAVAILVMGGLAWLIDRSGLSGPSAEDFIEQMEQAARGKMIREHVFGGSLSARVGNGTVVTATEVPQKACVQAGWTLVRKGVLSINGVTPPRVSAGLLAELCSSSEGGATLIWMPTK